MKRLQTKAVKAEAHSGFSSWSIHPYALQKKILQPALCSLPVRHFLCASATLYVNKGEQKLLPFSTCKIKNCSFACKSSFKQQAFPFFSIRRLASSAKKKKKQLMEAGWRNGNVIRRKSLFTPSQLQELEEQANIFNCLSLGLPIPTHLLCSLRRNRCSQPKLGFLPPYSTCKILLVSEITFVFFSWDLFGWVWSLQWDGVLFSWRQAGEEKIRSQGGVGERMGRNGGVQEWLVQILSTVKGIFIGERIAWGSAQRLLLKMKALPFLFFLLWASAKTAPVTSSGE